MNNNFITLRMPELTVPIVLHLNVMQFINRKYGNIDNFINDCKKRDINVYELINKLNNAN